MNCPYCNKQCSRFSGDYFLFTTYWCSSCLGKPTFQKWDDRPYSGRELLVSFYVDGAYKMLHHPNQTIYLFLNDTNTEYDIIKVNQLVTPNNFQEIYDRLINLKTFL